MPLGDFHLEKLQKQILDKCSGIPDVEDVWEEKPVSIEEFIKNPNFYGDGRENRVWPSLYEDLSDIFSGENGEPKYNTVVYLGGIGGGKSSAVGFVFSYMLYRLLCLRSPYKYFKMIDSTLAFMNLAPSGDKAKTIVFDKVVKTIERIGWFKDKKYLPDPRVRSRLNFPKGLCVVPGNSSQSFPLGADVYGGVIDEAAFFLNETSDPCEELYYALDERRKSRFGNRGLIMLVSSASVENAFIEKLALEGETNPNISVIRRTQWEAKPAHTYQPPLCGTTFKYSITHEKINGGVVTRNLNVPVEFEESVRRNPRRFLRDICAIPSSAIEPYFEDWERVVLNINKNRPDPIPDKGRDVPEGPIEVYRRLPPHIKGVGGGHYFMHVDLGSGKTGNCPCGVAIGHRGPDVVRGNQVSTTGVIDLITRFKGDRHHEIDFSQVREFIWLIARERNFQLVKITFDGWQSLEISQQLKADGFRVEMAQADFKCYETMKTMMYDGRLDYYYRESLFHELKRLELKNSKVLPALLSTKDESDCVARVCYMVVEEAVVAFDNAHTVKRRVRRGIVAPGLNSSTRVAQRGAIQNFQRRFGGKLY